MKSVYLLQEIVPSYRVHVFRRLGIGRYAWQPGIPGHLIRGRPAAESRQQGDDLGCSLVVVGDGSKRPALEEMAGRLGLPKVHFEGPICDERELALYFLLCDVFVTPGVASLAIKMALAFGKPVIAVNYGLEFHDIVDGVTGFVFPMDDDDKLAIRAGRCWNPGSHVASAAPVPKVRSRPEIECVSCRPPGAAAREAAVIRHDPAIVTEQLMAAYGKVLETGAATSFQNH